MSIDVMKAVWESSQHSETDLVVMLALADMANVDGYCFPSIPTLAQRARRQVRSMINTLERLSESGEVFIDKSRGRNHHNRYVITINMTKEKLAHVLVRYMDYDPTEAVKVATEYAEKHAVRYENMQPTACLTSAENMQSAAQNVQSTTQNVQSATLKRAADCTRSIIEPSIEPKENRKCQTSSASLGEQGKARLSAWQAELNLELEPKQRVPLASRLAQVCGLEAVIDAGDDVKNEQCHRAAITLYRMGIATPADLNDWYADYLHDEWTRKNNPHPAPSKVTELVSKKAQGAKQQPAPVKQVQRIMIYNQYSGKNEEVTL